MAAVVIPIIAQVASILAPLLPDLIRGAEQIFRARGSGEDRMDVVVQQARAVVDKAIARGDVRAAAMPTDAELRALVEGEFQRLKSAGELTAPAAKPLAGVYLLKGKLVPVSGVDLLD